MTHREIEMKREAKCSPEVLCLQKKKKKTEGKERENGTEKRRETLHLQNVFDTRKRSKSINVNDV